jgi:hypothetical protein
MTEDPPKTISVPEAGARYYDLSRNGSYDAAKRGEIPTIKVGRLLRVPVAAMERRLEQRDTPNDRRPTCASEFTKVPPPAISEVSHPLVRTKLHRPRCCRRSQCAKGKMFVHA